MGVEASRSVQLDLEKETKQRTIKFWNSSDYNGYDTSRSGSCMEIEGLAHAGRLLAESNVLNADTRILEVCAGNGHASNIVLNELKKLYPSLVITKTDRLEFPGVTKLLSHEAVHEYGATHNCLLLISPPPNTYVDYYAIKPFESLSGHRIVVFIGELGASDGGSGMYHYMMHQSSWTLAKRFAIRTYRDIFGMPVEKELFIFTKD